MSFYTPGLGRGHRFTWNGVVMQVTHIVGDMTSPPTEMVYFRRVIDGALEMTRLHCERRPMPQHRIDGCCDPVHDNVAHAIMLLHVNQGRYAMTAATIRRLVFKVTGREQNAGTQWTQGFRRQVGRLWTANGQPKVQGRETYVLTQAGVERFHEDVSTRGWSPDAYDAVALLDDLREKRMRRPAIPDYIADEVAV